jgi:hypothetical protein
VCVYCVCLYICGDILRVCMYACVLLLFACERVGGDVWGNRVV